MSSPVDDLADDAGTCAEQQLVEMETLQSIYSQDELQFDTDCAPYIMSYCDRCLNNENSEDVIAEVISQLKNEDLCLGLTLKLLMDGHPVEIKCDLPQSYPVSSPPLVFVRATGFKSRTSQAAFRKELDGYINNLELGDAMLFTVLDWLSDELPKHLVSGDMKADETPLDGPCSFTRMWIYSHHIYSKFKRRDIIAWAAELKLHGFSMCGKPGMICIEGHTEDVEEYWSRLRRLNWKRLVMKEREDTKCDTHKQLSEMYRFDIFEEMVFGSRAGKGYSVSFHADIGDLLKFLQERECSHIFEMYFGIDGKTRPTEGPDNH